MDKTPDRGALIHLFRRLTVSDGQIDYFEEVEKLKMHERASISSLIRSLLTHSEYGVRSIAGEVLLQLDSQTSLLWVLPLLKDPENIVRYSISDWLCLYADARAVDDLIEALLHDGDADVRANVATALGNIGDPRAIPVLHFVAEHDHAEDYEGSRVSSAAKQAIELIHNPPRYADEVDTA